LNEFSDRRRPVLLAHRGTSVMAPENTVPAFDFAQQHCADIFEIDVRLSRDNEVMVFHDETLQRTTNGTGAVRAMTVAELKQLDAGYRFQTDNSYSARDTGIRILTLTELLERYSSVRVNIDIKDADAAAVDAVGRTVEAFGAANRCVLASFHDAQVERCRARFPGIRLSMSMGEIKRYYARYLFGLLRGSTHSAGLFQVPVSYYGLSLSGRRFISSVHRGGGEINYWTINDPQQMRSLLERGADGIVTDRADLAVPVFEAWRLA
jgi:glycerophosphoryl diester phosphodiesterase